MGCQPLPPKSFDCAATRARASLFLDGRLRAGSRRHVQDHLRGCAVCPKFYRQLRELGGAARALPGRAAATDLRVVVRQEVARRRRGVLQRLDLGEHRAVAGIVAAAVLLLAVAASTTGYFVGRTQARGEVLDRSVAPIEPHRSVAADRPAVGLLVGVDARRFERAVRSLAQDIELIESVPVVGRVPLVTAQLDYFDLDRQAVRVLRESGANPHPHPYSTSLRELAKFVHGLAIAVADETQVPEWEQLVAAARRRGALGWVDPAFVESGRRRLRRRSARPDVARVRSAVAAVVDRVGRQLNPATRAALAELLEFKESFVEGRVEASIRYAQSTDVPTEPTGPTELTEPAVATFSLLTGAVVVQTLSEAGLMTAARTVVRTSIATAKDGNHSTWSNSAAAAEHMRAAEILRQLLRKFEH